MRFLNGAVGVDVKDINDLNFDDNPDSNGMTITLNARQPMSMAQVIDASHDTILPDGTYAKPLVSEGDYVVFNSKMLHESFLPSGHGIYYVPHKHIIASMSEAEYLQLKDGDYD